MREVNGSMAVTDIESRGRRLSAVEPPRRRETRLTSLTRALLTLVIIVTSVVGVALFGVSRGELWLDEAQSVAIARLPVGELLDTLRSDGAPPLYYLLLHAWIEVFGESTAAVRAMSGVFAIASLPAMWFLARALAGRRVAWSATALLATSPFLIRYSTETRMYSAVVLVVLLGGLAIVRAAVRPTIPRLALVTLASGALLLTHYWGFYVVAAVIVALAVETRRGHADWRIFVAVAAGGVLFLPWLPTFLYQLRHTGAPWAGRPTLGDFVEQLRAYAGGPDDLDSAGWVLWLLLIVLVTLGVFARRRRSGIVELRWRGTERGRQLGLITAATLGLAFVVGVVGDSPVAARYTAVAFPLVVILAALGLQTIGGRAAMALLAIATVAGTIGGYDAATTERTAAPRVASELDRRVRPGDVVVYCPDQLGPSTSRLVDRDVRQVTFPSLRDPGLVDWVDYMERIDATDLERFARRVDSMAGDNALWLVTAPNYLTMSSTCAALRSEIEQLRPQRTEVVRADGRFFEQAQLFRMRRTMNAA